MNPKRIFADVLTLILFIAAPVGMTAYSQSGSSGLIEKCSVSCTVKNDSELLIIAKTQAAEVMDSIGFKDVTIQKSSDGYNWENIRNIGSFSAENKKYYTITCSYKPLVTGYYRAVCTHFANGSLTAEELKHSQTADNASRTVYIEITQPTPIPAASTAVSSAVTKASAKHSTVTSSAVTSTAAAAKSSAKTESSSPSTGDSGAALPLTALAAGASLVLLTKRKRKIYEQANKIYKL